MYSARRQVSTKSSARGGASSRASGRSRHTTTTAPAAPSFTSALLASALTYLAEDYTAPISMFLLFVYGVLCGAMACVFFFFFVFYKVNGKLSHTIRKKSVKHQMFEEVAKAAAVVPAAKVETLCKVVCFDDDVVGEVIECRALLFSDTIVFYKVEKLTTGEDHRQTVTKETLLGKINRNCAVTSAVRLSKYHRHLDFFSRYSPIKGKVTILQSKDDDMPLFLDDPAARLQERLDEMRASREEARKARHSSGDAGAYAHQAASSASSSTHWPGSAHTVSSTTTTAAASSSLNSGSGRGGAGTWTKKMEDQLEALVLFAKTARGGTYFNRSGESPEDQKRRLRRELRKLLLPRGRRFGNGLGLDDVDMVKATITQDSHSDPTNLEAPVRQWRTIAIKFPNRRVNERWFNLLQGTSQTLQWQYYLNHLPHMDVLNLLLARLFFESNSTDSLHDLLRDKFQKNLSNASNNFGENLKGDIRLDGLTVGGEMPLFSNVSDCSVDQTGELDFDFDVLYRGGLMLTIRLANFSYRDLHVPDLLFHIKVLELSGRLHFNVGPPPTQKFWLGCRRAPDLRLEFTQEVASHEGILNVVLNILPDMSNTMTNVVKTLLFDDMVFPSFDDFPWPVVDGPERDKEKALEKAAKAAEAAAKATEEEEAAAAAAAASPSGSRKSAKKKKKGDASKADGTAASTPTTPVTVDNSSLASTVLSGVASRANGERSPAPRPVRSRSPTSAAAAATAAADSAAPNTTASPLSASGSAPSRRSRTVISGIPPTTAPTADAKSRRDDRAGGSDPDLDQMTPVLLSARNQDDDDDEDEDDEDPATDDRARGGASGSRPRHEDDEAMSSARRRRVGTVIRVSAPVKRSAPSSPLSAATPDKQARQVQQKEGLAQARAEAARTFASGTPIEYVGSGQSTVTVAAAGRPSTTAHTPVLSSTTNSNRGGGGRTRTSAGAEEEPVLFSGGSFASVASSTRASKKTKA